MHTKDYSCTVANKFALTSDDDFEDPQELLSLVSKAEKIPVLKKKPVVLKITAPLTPPQAVAPVESKPVVSKENCQRKESGSRRGERRLVESCPHFAKDWETYKNMKTLKEYKAEKQSIPVLQDHQLDLQEEVAVTRKQSNKKKLIHIDIQFVDHRPPCTYRNYRQNCRPFASQPSESNNIATFSSVLSKAVSPVSPKPATPKAVTPAASKTVVPNAVARQAVASSVVARQAVARQGVASSTVARQAVASSTVTSKAVAQQTMSTKKTNITIIPDPHGFAPTIVITKVSPRKSRAPKLVSPL